MGLKHEVQNIDGFVALVVTLIGKGYRYYFTGQVKEGKDLAAFDRRMIDDYEANLSKWTRERRKRRGVANFRYLRYGNFFLVLATTGEAAIFWREDRHRIRDVRVSPLKFKGYSISYRQGGNAKLTQAEKEERNAAWDSYRQALADGRSAARPSPTKRDMKWHVRVQLDDETYAGFKAYYLNIATHRDASFLAREFENICYQPYAPVREQLRCILRAVNQARHLAGFQRVPLSVLPFKRRIVKAFEEPRADEKAAA